MNNLAPPQFAIRAIDERGYYTQAWRGFLNQMYTAVSSISNTGNMMQATPINGFTVVVPDNVMDVILDPATSLASGTVTLPPNPTNAEPILISSSQAISTLTVASTNSAVKNGTVTLAAGAGVRFQYVAANNTWYRRY